MEIGTRVKILAGNWYKDKTGTVVEILRDDKNTICHVELDGPVEEYVRLYIFQLLPIIDFMGPNQAFRLRRLSINRRRKTNDYHRSSDETELHNYRNASFKSR